MEIIIVEGYFWFSCHEFQLVMNVYTYSRSEALERVLYLNNKDRTVNINDKSINTIFTLQYVYLQYKLHNVNA